MATELPKKQDLISLSEALDYFENLCDDDELINGPESTDVTISPPLLDDGASDDDSGDESCNNPDVLLPKQLSAMAETHSADDKETENFPQQSDADEPDDRSDEEPLARRRRVMSHTAQCNFKNRFEEITQFLHFCNNEEHYGRDKMGKIRPLLDLHSNKFIANAPDCKNISVDEGFGYGTELWTLPCCRLISRGNPSYMRPGDQGLGESVVVTFCDSVMTSFPGIQFSFYFGKFLSNTKLISSLSEKGMKGTGTARINRMGKCPIADKKVMQKHERGSYEVYTEENKGISAVAWKDNNVVYTLSNEH
ncbi:hypothetical protein PR048_011487 [Dryococelus australis]|uniref:PiggyBac transposable element-derived protein domain-containing protein n=1 Tax=Dryococelus australis TaxID=614101 RepID=A0ABQ9HLX0_9NEOP|nr:hypothetical protein PR048_011487 [Dryococelus australis]